MSRAAVQIARIEGPADRMDLFEPDRVTHWIDHLIEHVPIAREGFDPEGVHRVRVAIARLRVLLELHGARELRDELRCLRDAAAPVRDLDVHLARNPPRALREHLERERARAHQQLVRALDDPRFETLLRRLRDLPPLDRPTARRRLARIAAEAVRRGRSASKHPRDPERLHRLRCSVHRSRFALDWISRAPKSLSDLQDALGVAGDAMAALAQLEHAPHRHGNKKYRRELERDSRRACSDALDAWADAKPLFKSLASLPDRDDS